MPKSTPVKDKKYNLSPRDLVAARAELKRMYDDLLGLIAELLEFQTNSIRAKPVDIGFLHDAANSLEERATNLQHEHSYKGEWDRNASGMAAKADADKCRFLARHIRKLIAHRTPDTKAPKRAISAALAVGEGR